MSKVIARDAHTFKDEEEQQEKILQRIESEISIYKQWRLKNLHPYRTKVRSYDIPYVDKVVHDYEKTKRDAEDAFERGDYIARNQHLYKNRVAQDRLKSIFDIPDRVRFD